MANGSTHPWTQERTERLKQLWADGVSAGRIASELGGTSRNAVIGKVHRLGLKGRRRTPAHPWIEAGVSRRTWQRQKANGHRRPTVARVAACGSGHVVRTSFVLDEERFMRDLVPDVGTLTLMQLENHHCRWPCSGEGITPLFCGDPSADLGGGQPYCQRHTEIAGWSPRPHFYPHNKRWQAHAA